MSRLYITFGFRAREDWDVHMPPAKIDGRWKQATIDAKMPELNAKRLEESPTHLAAGTVEDIAVQMADKITKFKDPSEFVKWADGLVGHINIVGIDLLHALRHCGWDCIRKKKATPAWLWNPPFETSKTLVNLKTMSGIKTEGIEIGTWLNTWGITWPTGLDDQVKAVAKLADLMGV